MVLTGEEVAKHNSEKSCWVIIHVRSFIHSFSWETWGNSWDEAEEASSDGQDADSLFLSHQGKAYDVTEFLPGMYHGIFPMKEAIQ